MRNNRQKELLYAAVTIFSAPFAIQYRRDMKTTAHIKYAYKLNTEMYIFTM